VRHGSFSVIAGQRYGLRRNGAQGLRW
jgi:hypothetical protein